MAYDEPWKLSEDGYLNVDTDSDSIIYHPNLNIILVSTKSSEVHVIDVNSGVILQKSSLSGCKKGVLRGTYLVGHDKILFTDGKGIGVRRDYNGVMLLDTILQTPISKSDDVVKLELLLSEAILLQQCLKTVDLPGVENVGEIQQELAKKIKDGQEKPKTGTKAQKWSSICLEVAHSALKQVCSGLVSELKRNNRHIPALSIASAINERLGCLLPGCPSDVAPTERAQMFSEAARIDTFVKWPHMHYKWALPAQMAQAGFYHQPNATGDDRAMCFTCNVCLVCWEPTDEPWSEHERHSPSCPFVKGEYTQNVPLSVSFASSPAATLGLDAVAAVGTSSVVDLVPVATSRGHVVVWNVARQLKRDVSFVVSASEVLRRARDDKQREVWPRGWSHVAPATGEAEPSTNQSEQDSSLVPDGVVRVDAVSVVGGPPSSCPQPRPCVIAGLSAPAGPVTAPEMAWGGAGCSAMVLAMNDVNEQSNRQTAALDIMAADICREPPTAALYLVVYDFHYASDSDAGAKDALESVRRRGKHKSATGTGTSAAASGARHEANNMYQEMFLSKFLYDGPGLDDGTEGDVVISGSHLNHQDCLDVIDFGPMPSSSVGNYPLPFGVSSGGGTLDASVSSFSTLNGVPEFASTSEVCKAGPGSVGTGRLVKKSSTESPDARRCPAVVQTVALPADPGLGVVGLHPTRDGAHLLVLLGPPPDAPAAAGAAMVFALDLSAEVVRLAETPVAARQLLPGECPVDVVLLPLAEHDPIDGDTQLQQGSGAVAGGRAALVGRDGTVRILDLASLAVIASATPPTQGLKFVSAAFCNSLERLCACTDSGSLHFFPLSADEELAIDGARQVDNEEAEFSRTPRLDWSGTPDFSPAASAAHSPTASCHAGDCRLAVDCPSLGLAELLEMQQLTRHENLTPLFAAAVPPCWTEMMQAQKQRRHPQHLQQGEEPQHTRSWRLQNDATTWDEHVFELTLPRSCSVGHLDVKFSLHAPCPTPPNVQVTLLKQNANGIGRKEPFGTTSVDQPVGFCLAPGSSPGPSENPVTTQEYLRDHNTEILCGPVNLSACLDLSDTGGSVTLTSPKLFAARGRTLLVHMKAVSDEGNKHDSSTSKPRSHVPDEKATASKRSKLDSLFAIPALERTAAAVASGVKKTEYYLGCDWLHEVSITIRKTKQTTVPHESLQRSVLLESDAVAERLLLAACSATLAPAAQGVALDVLVWVASVRLARNRSNRSEVRAQQLAFARIVERHLPALIERCVLLAGRSVAHKCVKLVVICSEGIKNAADTAVTQWDACVLRALLDLLPALPCAKSAGALRWFLLLLARAMALDTAAAAAQKCLSLLQQVGQELSSRSTPEHLVLRTRFGLYGTPLEPELFDVDPPAAGKATSVPVTYATVAASNDTAGGVAICTTGPTIGTHGADVGTDVLDLRELLALPVGLGGLVDSVKGVPGRLKGLSSGHFMKGLLEVEPLHFTCHAASDGTKMEKVEPGVQTPPTVGNFFDSANFVTSNVATKVADSSFADLQTLKSLVSLHKVKSKSSTVIIELDKNKHSDTSSSSSSQQSTMSGPAMFLTSTVDAVSLPQADFPVSNNTTEDCNAKDPTGTELPWQLLLVPQPQHMLVVERMHSGARRFVVMDLGGPVLLTDLLIPSCSDLVSLSVDIWLRGEELDGQRLVVAADIGTKSLVMSDLQPPPICRYVKITTIGRYGMSTTRCRIPIGSFFGHLVVLPGESYDCPASAGPSPEALDVQLCVLSSLLEDVHCRYSLACAKLRDVLQPLLSEEIPNATHMHHFLQRPAASERPAGSDKVHAAYQECVTFQRQLNLVRGVIRRLECANSDPVPSDIDTGQLLRLASTDKLRVLGEGLLDTLLYLAYEIGPVPRLPASLFNTFDLPTCQRLFAWLCVREDVRMQLGTCTLLVRMCGHQPWWGDFLADTLTTLYASHANAADIFPQDRVFLLVTYLGRKSLASGASRALVLDSTLATLARHLSNSSAGNGFLRAHMDLSLVGWLLLFLSICLDTSPGSTQPSEQEKNKESQATSSRWDFIQGEAAMQKRLATSHRSNASRSYRRKLQKRLMHHKQQLEDLEAAKKAFHASTQALSVLSSQAANLSSKLEAALKQHEQVFKKTLKQHSAKHFKDILQIRRTEVPNLSPKCSASGAGPSRHSTPPKEESIAEAGLLCLPLEHCLPVARGLLSLLLSMDFTCNVDTFLLACKVIARIVVSTRPAITLSQLMSADQLVRLLRLAACNDQHKGCWGGPWASHAICCLLQDLLDAAHTFPPAHEDTPESSGPAETDETTPEEFPAQDKETEDKTGGSGFQLQSLLESEDSELEDFLDDILERGRTLLRRGNASRAAASASAAVSAAMDARLEYGVDAAAEVTLKRLTALGAYNLPLSVGAAICPPPESAIQPSESSWPPELLCPPPNGPNAPDSRVMLATAFHALFAELHSHQGWVSLELGLQLWLSLSSETDPVALGAGAATGLLSALAWRPGVSLRAWTLAFRALTQMAGTPHDDVLDNEVARAIVNDSQFVPALLRFLSGSTFGTKGCAGPTTCLALSDLLVRLQTRCGALDRASVQGAEMRRALLALVSALVHPAGALATRQGPLDAQCRLLDVILNADFFDIDAQAALGLVDAIASLTHSYIAGLDRVRCRSASEPLVSAAACFGGLFSSVLGGGAPSGASANRGKAASWDTLVSSLLQLANKLARQQVHRADRMDTDSQNEACYLAELVLGHEPTTRRLLSALGSCSGSSLAMLLGPAAAPETLALGELGDPLSVGDAIFQLLSTLAQKASEPWQILRPLLGFLSTETALGAVLLSEPLLWLLLRVLDSPAALSEFAALGGVAIVGQNLVQASAALVNTHPSLVSVVMQHLSNSPAGGVTVVGGVVRKAGGVELCDGQLNFAPLGTISSSNPTAQPADVLIASAPPHRRARTPAWSHHFYPDEAFVELSITLPCAVLLKQVQLQPHLTALATCPAAVALEVCRDSVMAPVCAPLDTSGMTFVRLVLPEPEVVTAVLLRLYKPRDSSNIGLSQIRLLGSTTFGETSNAEFPDEEQLTKSSLGWLRLLHHCVCTPGPAELSAALLDAAAGVPRLLEACCGLLLVPGPAPHLFAPSLERVLLKLGLRSKELGLAQLDTLLKNNAAAFAQGSVAAVDSAVELVYRLCSTQDAWTGDRVAAVLRWLRETAAASSAPPCAAFVRAAAAIVWDAAENPWRQYDLQALVSEDLFTLLCDWTCSLPPHAALKKAVDSVLCSMCRAVPALWPELLDKMYPGVAKLSASRLGSLAAASQSDDAVTMLLFSRLLEELVEFLAKSCRGGEAAAPDDLALVLDFFAEICAEGRVRDWLGSEQGSVFWLPLLTVLCNKTAAPSAPTTSENHTALESATVRFLSRCCWCHPTNQRLASKTLCSVIGSQRARGISGFTRRLILQLLLEDEKIFVFVRASFPLAGVGAAGSYHPRYGVGHQRQLLYLSTQTTCADILKWCTPPPASLSAEHRSAESTSGRKEPWELGLGLVDQLALAAGATAKDKRAKEAKNAATRPAPYGKRPRASAEVSPSTSSFALGVSSCLALASAPEVALPPALALGQLLAQELAAGHSLSAPCLALVLTQSSKQVGVAQDSASTSGAQGNRITNGPFLPTPLQVFSDEGGLALLAQHLPQVYPETLRYSTDKGAGNGSPTEPGTGTGAEAEWVKVEAAEDMYDELDDGAGPASPAPTTPPPSVPPHALAAFGLFLRLPGYATVLLVDRKKAQCLLRLVLGVTDDGEGGDILSLPLASSLHTLPFCVLRQLFDSTPRGSEAGAALRRATVDIGAMHLLLGCLAVFTHQTQDLSAPGATTEVALSGKSPAQGERKEDKPAQGGHLYWAKGTGFGTGSTAQAWNVEQALMRQRSEEEHVTVLLQVISGFMNPGNIAPDSFLSGWESSEDEETPPSNDGWLPAGFVELAERSCLLPAVSSYLRNDSVLDMARHIPLYRAVLQLLRAMAYDPRLAALLLPSDSQAQRAWRGDELSVVCLLTKMKGCVDTYASRLRANKGKGGGKTRTPSKLTEELESDEGLALFIFDIQETANLVQLATERLVLEDEVDDAPRQQNESPLGRSLEDRYLEVMKRLQFDSFEMITEAADAAGGFQFVVAYHFEASLRAAGERCHPSRVKRLAQETVTLSTSLPLSYSSSVFVRCDTDRLDIMKVLMTGPAETPYANGCFEFDVYFPPDYPNSPMMINLETTGHHTIRFNPNLYNDGKVCLSVLNTWHGRPEEKWNAATSSFLQVLVSIQSLILVPEPYFNEPGYERSRGTPSGNQSSREYNSNICQATVKWAMLEQVRSPCPCFKDVIHTHFWMKRHEIVAQVEAWIAEMEGQTGDRRAGRAISLNAMALKRHFRQLRDELAKLTPPEGLADLADPPSEADAGEGAAPGRSTPPAVSADDADIDMEMEKMVSKVCE